MKRTCLSFSQYLFFSVTAIYCVFVAGFLYYQYHREKLHKVELLNSTLTMFNVDLYDHLSDPGFSVEGYVERYKDDRDKRINRLRITEKSVPILKIHEDFHAEMVDKALDKLDLEENELLNETLENILK